MFYSWRLTLHRFYQRIALIFVIFYTTVLNAPFLRGVIAWLVCMSILALDLAYVSDFNDMQHVLSLTLSRYKPFLHRDMQRLSSVCCILLVTMSSVLLRSQSLLSSARFINFDPSNPVEAAETQTVDVNYTIIILICCIFVPFAVALKLHQIFLACFTLLKKLWIQFKQHGHLFTGALNATACNINLSGKIQVARLSEDMSTVRSTKKVADAPHVRSQSVSENAFAAQTPYHNVDAIVLERVGVNVTPWQASPEHTCDPVDIDLTEYNDCGDDASSIRKIIFRRPKALQVHRNKDEAFVVHIDDTIFTPSDASPAFALSHSLRIDVLDALNDRSASLPVVTVAEADECKDTEFNTLQKLHGNQARHSQLLQRSYDAL
jgi:hypothetical protein